MYMAHNLQLPATPTNLFHLIENNHKIPCHFVLQWVYHIVITIIILHYMTCPCFVELKLGLGSLLTIIV